MKCLIKVFQTCFQGYKKAIIIKKNLLTLRSPLTSKISWAKLCVIFAINLSPCCLLLACDLPIFLTYVSTKNSGFSSKFILFDAGIFHYAPNSGKMGIHIVYSFKLYSAFYTMLRECLLNLESSWVHS